MNIDTKKDLFNEKGYCLLKLPNERFDKPDDVIRSNDNIKSLREKLSHVNELAEQKIDYQERILDNYLVIYDSSRVHLEIIKKLSDFVEVIANEKINFDRKDHIFFRGHSKTEYKIEPSIYRIDNKNVLMNEDKLYRDLLSSKPHFFEDCNTTLEKLVKMQHHGIPTRLLDLTDNPLIALYFACNTNRQGNGEVLVFNIREDRFKYFDSDTVAVISNLAKCGFNFDITQLSLPHEDYEWRKVSLRMKGSTNINARAIYNDYYEEKVSEFNKNTIVSELVHYVREDKPYFLNKIDPKNLIDYTVVVKAKMSIYRMINQSGAFILFGINKCKSRGSNSNINKEGYTQKVIIIPAQYKCSILKELEMFNINDATVFGDLDTTAKFFTNKYR